MVFPVVGGTQSTDYAIDNSLRFNDSDSAYLSITPSSAGNRRTFTYSGWIKTDVATASSKALLSCGSDSGSNDYIMFQSGDRLRFSFGTEGNGDIITTRLFRDPAAWYHIVWAVDTTQGTAANRVKLYVNGTQASDVSGTYPDQNYDTSFNNTEVQRIGARAYSATQYYEGHMSDVYLIDGAQKAASDFGETNDNGVWIPKKYTGTYGTNGFKLEFQQTGTSANASGMGADTSGNGNHLTPSNLTAQDVTTDTPTNNFCTMNPLYSYSGIGFKDGNLEIELGGSNHRWGTSTFFVANGKWYFECKLLSDSNYNSGPGVIAYGIDDPITTEGGGAGSKAEGWIYLSTSAGDLQHGGTQYGTASAATTNDILMVAFDVDNGKIWIGKNGTWSEGSNPSTGNGAVREDLGDASSGLFSPAVSGYAENMVFNFGNPTFSISSGNADANGYGNFEYAVPSGFYSLCTKNLAEYG